MKTNNNFLTAPLVQSFVENFLLDTYSNSHPITWFHRELWEYCCDSHPFVAIAAPRAHSKSTSINHGYGLAAALFQQHPFQLKISKTHKIAVEYVRSAKYTVLNNSRIRHHFKIKPQLVRDTEDDFIAECASGYQFRMMAYGSEQAMRGATWGTRRPGLVICDDLEDDEQVLSEERRQKMQDWFWGALLPIGDQNTKFRVTGTILHIQSLLQSLLDNPEWKSKVYEAHNDDFTEILWPEVWPRERLMQLQRMFQGNNNLIKYNMEYRNIAIDTTSGFFQNTDFVPMNEANLAARHKCYVGGDLAISRKKRRDSTCFMVGGVDEENFLDILDRRKGRWDGNQIIEEMISIQRTYEPDEWYIESGSILLALMPMIELAMRKENIFMNIKPMIPMKEKQVRARSIQTRMRQRGVRYNAEAAWFAEHKQSMLQFRGGDEPNDDADAMAWLGLGLARMIPADSADEEEAWIFEKLKRTPTLPGGLGRNPTTGY